MFAGEISERERNRHVGVVPFAAALQHEISGRRGRKLERGNLRHQFGLERQIMGDPERAGLEAAGKVSSSVFFETVTRWSSCLHDAPAVMVIAR